MAVFVAMAACTLWMATRNIQLHREVTEMQKERTDLLAKDREMTQQLARLNEQLLVAGSGQGPGSLEPTIASLTLMPGLVRTGSKKNKLVIRPDTSIVRLKLNLDHNDYSHYRVLLETVEGNSVWQQKAAAPVDKVILVELPAKALTEGDYVVRLTGTTAAGVVEEVYAYSFRVVRR